MMVDVTKGSRYDEKCLRMIFIPAKISGFAKNFEM